MANWNFKRIKIPKGLTIEEREALSDVTSNYVRARSLKGNGSGAKLGGKKWAGVAGKYVKEYAKIKGRKSPVDLRSTNEMMKKIKGLEESSAQYIKIGFDKPNDKLSGKVEGNRRGTYGQSKPIAGKARDFLIVSPEEISALVKIIKTKEDSKKLIDEGRERAVSGVKIGNN